MECLKCKKEFSKTSRNQKYCGSSLKKTGCSYLARLENERKRKKKPENRKKILRQGRIWWKNKVSKDPEYIKRKRDRDRNKYSIRRLKVRFRVFERDSFTCQYCGRKAPEVVLNIDHIYPKSKGGLDKMSNYKTSCKECNLGKGDYILNEFN